MCANRPSSLLTHLDEVKAGRKHIFKTRFFSVDYLMGS